MSTQGLGWCAARSAVCAGAVLAFALGGCGNLLHLPQMPWSHPKTMVSRSSPYAPVPIGPPLAPAPPLNTTQYGTSVDQVVASVDGNPITRHDIKNPNAAAGGVNSLTGGNIRANGLDRQTILKQLIAQQLLDDEARKFADKVDDADVERYIEALEQRDHVTDAQLRAQLQAQGMSYDAFHQAVFRQVAAIDMINREVREKIHIPDSEIKAYYNAHPQQFSVSAEKYRLAQILIALAPNAPADKVALAQHTAEKARALAVAGHDFGDLARQYSDDDSKNKGGELGEFDPSDLNDRIAAAVKQTTVGSITPIIRTRYGFHIIKVEAHQQPGEQPLAAVREQIREALVDNAAKTKFPQWVEHDLAKQHDVEIIN